MANQLPLAVILSDMHIGDERGVVLESFQPGYTTVDGLFVRKQFLEVLDRVDLYLEQGGGEAAKVIPFLILVGDVWDVAIRNLEDVAVLSQRFFEAVRLDQRFGQIIFLPGNHDHHLWRMVQTQVCVVNPLENAAGRISPTKKPVRPFPQAQSGWLLPDKKKGYELYIPDVTPPYEGNVFVTGLTKGLIPVNVAYPNLYVIHPDREQAALITHGHFFQLAWRLLSELTKDALRDEIPAMDLYYLELINSPLTEFINHSIAQLGPLSSFVNRVYDEVRSGRTPAELKQVLKTLKRFLDEELDYEDEPWLEEKLKEAGSDALIKLAMKLLEKGIKSALEKAKSERALPSGRQTRDFFQEPKNAATVDEYIRFARREIPNQRVSTLIYGHTHETQHGDVITLPFAKEIRAWNPGSLVSKFDRCDFMPIGLYADGAIRAIEP